MRLLIGILLFFSSVNCVVYAQDTLPPRQEEVFELDERSVSPGRVVVTPTAFGIPKGAVQYTNGMLLYNRADVGLFSFLSVHAAVAAWTGVPFSAGIKLTTPRRTGYIRAALGCTYADDIGTPNNNEIGTWVPYGALTFGRSPASQATVSSGVMINTFYGYTKFVSLAATQRFSKRFYLLMDFMLANMQEETIVVNGTSTPDRDYQAHEQFIPFIGVRYLWNSVSADISIVPPLNQPNNLSGFPIPVATFTYRLN